MVIIWPTNYGKNKRLVQTNQHQSNPHMIIISSVLLFIVSLVHAETKNQETALADVEKMRLGDCRRRHHSSSHSEPNFAILRDAFPGCLIHTASVSSSSSSSSHRRRRHHRKPHRKPCSSSSSSSSSSCSSDVPPPCRKPCRKPKSSSSSSCSSSSSSSSASCPRKPKPCRKPCRKPKPSFSSVEPSACPPCNQCKPSSSSLCPPMPSSSSCPPPPPCTVCPKHEAVPIVRTLHKKINHYLNQKRFHDAWPYIQPSAAYYILQKPPRGACGWDFGSIKQLFPRYMAAQTKSVIRGYHYFKDGSVALHTLDLVSSEGCEREQYDMYYYYAATFGCDYKLAYMTGRNLKCKDCKGLSRKHKKSGFPQIPEDQFTAI